MTIYIEPYPAALDAIEERLTEMGKEARMRDVLKKAVNETAKTGKDLIFKETRSTYTIKGSAFKKSDIEKKPTTVRNPGATLIVKGEPLGIRKSYRNRKNSKKKGASAMVLGSGAMKELKIQDGERVFKAFVARMQSGHEGIFQRVPGKRMKSKPWREAVKEITSLSKSKAAEMAYKKNGVYTEIEAELTYRLLKHMDAVIGGLE